MKNQWLVPLGCVVVGVVVGRLTTCGGASGPAGDDGRDGAGTPLRVSKSGVRTRDEGGTAWSRLRDDIRAGSSDHMPALLYRALELSDPVERRGLMFEAFRGMDESNWREMYAQFARITRETGREHKVEWELARIRIGQVGGREAVEWVRGWDNGGGEDLGHMARGWAMADPGAALAWLDELQVEDPAARRRVSPLVLGGVALRDGPGAIPLLEALPLAERCNCVGHFTWNLVQHSGLDAAVDWAIRSHRTAGPAGPAEQGYARRVSRQVFDRALSAAAGRGGGHQLAGFVARLHEVDPFDRSRLINAVNRLSGTEGLDLLAGLAGTPVIEDGAASSPELQIAVRRAMQGGPDAVDLWLERNPDAPFAETVRKMVGRR